MRALGRLALRLAVALGWGVILLAGGLWIAEETGLVGRVVRATIAARAGALGADIAVHGARLRWFDRAVEIERLEVGPNGELARLTGLRFEFRPWLQAPFELARIEVHQGSLDISQALLNQLEVYSEQIRDADGMTRAPPRLPTIQVESLDVALVTRELGTLPLGRVDLLARSNARGLPELFGRVTPGLTPRGAEPGRVYLSGAIGPGGGLVLRANAASVPIGTDALPADPGLADARAADPSGTLELEAWAEIPADGTAPRGEVRCSLRRARLRLASGAHRFEGVQVDAQARWEPASLRAWRDPHAWHGLARASGLWNGSRAEATALYGSEAGASQEYVAWVHAAAFPLERALTDGFGGIAQRVWDGLAPRGTSELWAAARLARTRGTETEPAIEACAVLRPGGGTGLTYHGMNRTEAGLYDEGFPLPLDRVSGEVAFAFGGAGARPYRIALHGLSGNSQSSSIRCSGVVQAHERDASPELASHGYAELDLELDGAALTVGDPLRQALRGLAGPLPPEGSWLPFQPEGGDLDIQLRLVRHVGDPWVAVDLGLAMRDTALIWDELPIPVSHSDGGVKFRSDGHGQRELEARLAGRARTATRVAVRVHSRTQSEPLPEGAWQDLDELSLVAVEVERVSLAGEDRRILVESLDEAGGAFDELSPRGFADCTYERVRWDRAREIETRAQITALDPAQLVPRALPLAIEGVRGRALVTTGPDADGVRLAPLVGQLRDGVDVVVEATLPGEVRVHAAGVDPADPSVAGALGAEIGGASLPAGALVLRGRLDVLGRIPISTETAGASEWRILLRDSGLSTSTGFSLDALRGELGYQSGRLHGSNLDARLASTPVTIDEISFVARPGEGLLDVRFDAIGVPVDREHLQGFVGAETIDALLGELGWSGRLDVGAGRLLLSVPASGDVRLELSGALTPHDMEIRIGLPMVIAQAHARLDRLVLEGGRVRALLVVEDLQGSLAGRALADARMLVTYHEPTLSIESLEGALEGGRIRALGADADRAGTAISIALQEPYPFGLALDLRGVELEGLLRGLFPSGVATRGKVEGELRLAGDLQRLLGIRGSGWLRVRDSGLWSVPVFRALFGQLGLDSTATFDSMYANLSVADGIVSMRDIVVRSPLLQLHGSGELDFDGRLEHDLELRYALVDQLGPLTRMIYWLQNELLTVQIRGDMGQPRVVLINPISRLFGGGEGFRALPTPGYAPLPGRF